MSAMHNRRRRRHTGGGGEHGGGAGMERWLLTYADMITLLMALFIVMWSISSVNTSKFDVLKRSLREAFSGNVFSGSPNVLSGEGNTPLNAAGTLVPNVTLPNTPARVTIPSPAQRFVQMQQQLSAGPGQAELENLTKVKQQVDAYAKAHGLEGKIDTSIDERGLVIRLLTDQLLFDTGKADLKPRALPLLDKIGTLLAKVRFQNPIRIEGNTDNVPISTAQFRSNWELSTARATAVLEVMLAEKVSPGRLSAAGFADQRPIASNSTPQSRALNRRVEIVVIRRAALLNSTG